MMNTLPETSSSACPACGSDAVRVFYVTPQIPVHSVLLFFSRNEAVSYPRGDLRLGLCGRCGFIFNDAYTAEHLEYSSRYEETQGFSATFNAFHRDLATRLVTRFNLHGKRVLEIGCGKGEFLHLLCSIGDNTGVGFDPVYVPERDSGEAGDRVRFVRDLYSERYADVPADFVCCKMTLEHIPNVFEFVRMVRLALERSPQSVVFFQIPDATRVLKEQAFWDVYYEHCSYFTTDALRSLFVRAGFAVDEVWTEYDGQVLMIAARPSTPREEYPVQERLDETARLAADFARGVAASIDRWRQSLLVSQRRGQKTVVWGAGSKAVAFLTKLGPEITIEYAVDVNPHKDGTFLAGTGQKIVGPRYLQGYRPDIVVVMNPVYVPEIEASLKGLDVRTTIRALT